MGARTLTPLVLVGLCLLVWFEPWIPGAASLDDKLVLRLVVGLLCLFALVQLVERQRLTDMLGQVIARLQRVRASGGEEPRDPEEVATEAMAILVAALDAEDPEVRRSAVRNLERISGQKFGEDAARWRAYLAAARSADSGSGLGGSEASS